MSQRSRPLILLVDDSLTQAQQSVPALEAAGFRVRLARNGREALEQARQWQPDVIVSDILMPVMDGFALCREVRRDATLTDVPIILHTITYIESKDEDFALALGATRFVVKPADPADLVGEIQAVLGTGHVAHTSSLAADDEAFLRRYSERVAAKLEDKVAELEQTNRQLELQIDATTAARDRLALLLETSRLVASSRDTDLLAAQFAALLVQRLRVRFCRLWLLDATGRQLIVAGAYPDPAPDGDHGSGRSVPLALAPLQREVLADGLPRVVPLGADDAISAMERAAAGLGPGGSVLLVPIVSTQPEGLLHLGEPAVSQPGAFSDDLIELAQAMAAQAAVAFENVRLHQAQLQAERELRLLTQVEAVLAGSGDASEVLRRTATQATDLIAESCLLSIHGMDEPAVYHPDPSVGKAIVTLLAARSSHDPTRTWLQSLERAAPLVLADPPDADANGPERPYAPLLERLAAIDVHGVMVAPLQGPHGRGGSLVWCDRRPEQLTAARLPFAQRVAERIARGLEERRLRGELMATRAAAQAYRQMDSIKSEFVGIVAHEVRGPLGLLVSYTEMLLTMPVDESERRMWLETMHAEATRLSALVTDLLDVARIESGRLETKRAQIDLEPLVEQVVKAFESQTTTHELQYVFPESLPPVLADRDKLIQVLTNLVSNAIKYAPHGGTITLSAAAVDGTARISVADEGLGLPPEALPRLFTQFYRVREGPWWEIRGTGLGLYISRQLVELQGGRIWAESRGRGQGSTFYVELPLSQAEPASTQAVAGP